ncbi:MAG TPA: hypothetical protein VK308_05145 [Pyrinomonadaceae bacterium]|nr:hypothetical protein [Pyrinomonadaceae bacterium]
MKKLILAFSLMLVGASVSFAQIVTITPKKTVYTRKGKVSLKEKRTFVVTYPVVTGAIPAATKKKLANTINYWRVFETSLRENLTEYDWLSELSYEVNYNKNGILDIALMQEGSGAYPSGRTVHLVVDLKTGEQIKFKDAFKTDSLGKLAAMVNAKLEVEKKEIIKLIDKGEFGESSEPNEMDPLKEQVGGLSFTAKTFDEFSISDKGVTFIYDAGFPHVIKAAQPDGRYFFTWAELKPFIKPAGLLGRFVS